MGQSLGSRVHEFKVQGSGFTGVALVLAPVSTQEGLPGVGFGIQSLLVIFSVLGFGFRDHGVGFSV